MRSRREQVQAHRFVTRRIVSALLSGEPESPELPMRRLAMAVFGSILVAAIVFAGVGVYGMLNPGGRRPAENTLLIERESGALYLYVQGRLHPVLNYTSARLILNQPNPPVRTMSGRSLLDVPRGRPIGIPNAPDALPGRASLLDLPWSVCSAPRSATSVEVATHVFVGHVPFGGEPLLDRGLLVNATGTGDEATTGLFLLYRDQRLRVRGNTTLAALEWAPVRPVAVGGALLNAIPPGPDLVAATVPAAGLVAPQRVNGQTATIGEVFRAGALHYVMLASGLSPIGEVMSRLLLAGGNEATEISAEEAGRALTTARLEPANFPTTIPQLLPTEGRLGMACAGYRGVTDPARSPITIETYAQASAEFSVDTVAPPAATGTDGVVTADRVSLPGGYAAVVSTLQETAPGNVYLVTDQGVKYPIPRAKVEQVLTSLGYGGKTPVPVPASMLALVPTSAALDPEAATRFAPLPTVSTQRPNA